MRQDAEEDKTGGKIEEPWPGGRVGRGSVLRPRSNQHFLSCLIMQRHEHTLENVLRFLSTMFNAIEREY